MLYIFVEFCIIDLINKHILLPLLKPYRHVRLFCLILSFDLREISLKIISIWRNFLEYVEYKISMLIKLKLF